ncbi:MAG: pyridoxamine 5'-phosphate oxidase family protein, partial [Kordiimonadaceae bacterium]|nr:pyridoxamine 5'-phosphate oxidase family protein [Kordiimonadaceae bacterium]
MSKVISEYGKPFALVNEWVAEAEASEPNDPTAMSLATTTLSGRPSVRMVLLKGCDERG